VADLEAVGRMGIIFPSTANASPVPRIVPLVGDFEWDHYLGPPSQSTATTTFGAASCSGDLSSSPSAGGELYAHWRPPTDKSGATPQVRGRKVFN
jgi:hypothetical protein